MVRTLLFAWRQRALRAVEGVPVDARAVAERLAAAIRCQTVPLDDTGTPDPEAFRQLHQLLQECYPLVHQKLKREVINGYSLLYTWQGSRPDLEPVMLMAHQDVVSADPTEWTHPPFDGVIVDGFIWGRGTLDIKNQLIGIMDAAETLLQQGYRPERTILFGLGHDEETGGVNGCKVMGQLLKERGVHLAGIVDEGGGISAGLAAGRPRRDRADRREREGLSDGRVQRPGPAGTLVHPAAADRDRHPGARPGPPGSAPDADAHPPAAGHVSRDRQGRADLAAGRLRQRVAVRPVSQALADAHS